MRLLLLAVVVAALVGVAPAWSSGKPLLRVVAGKPLTVAGARFRSDERVTLTAIVSGRHVRKVTASIGGRFRVRFRGVQVPRCPNYVITAVGARGSFAILRIHAECASP